MKLTVSKHVADLDSRLFSFSVATYSSSLNWYSKRLTFCLTLGRRKFLAEFHYGTRKQPRGYQFVIHDIVKFKDDVDPTFLKCPLADKDKLFTVIAVDYRAHPYIPDEMEQFVTVDSQDPQTFASHFFEIRNFQKTCRTGMIINYGA